MLFELIFMALCISAIVQANKLKKLKRQFSLLELALREYVTQSPPAAPLGQEQDCVTTENVKG